MTGPQILAAVFLFNLLCLPLWFVVGFLRRNHDQGVARMQAFLKLADGKPRPEEVAPQLQVLRDYLAQAEHLGPLWGRKAVTSGMFWMDQLEELHGEALGDVLAAMRR